MLSVAIVAALVAAVGGGLVMGAVMLVSWLLAAAVSMGTSIGVGAGSSRTAAGVFGQLAVLLLPALLLGAVSVLIYETGTLHFTRHTMGGGDIAGQLPWMLYAIAQNALVFFGIFAAMLVIRSLWVSLLASAALVALLVAVPALITPASLEVPMWLFNPPSPAVFFKSNEVAIELSADFQWPTWPFLGHPGNIISTTAGCTYLALLVATIIEALRHRRGEQSGSRLFKFAIGLPVFLMILVGVARL
jgi:hypothetical protein